MAKKDPVNPRLLAATRMRAIFSLRAAAQLTTAEYRDYLSWVHIMVDVERQRIAQRGSQAPLRPDLDSDEEALDSEAAA